ncbi:MAG: PIG-L deacetylase family protein [Ramlibacter sp.]|nr:PIG-L deacetylase family protein [Ramlibacter sp.]
MVPLKLPQDAAAPLEVLCLGAHADDIEIGCGGTLLQLLSARANVKVVWVVFSSAGAREAEARTSASLFLERARQKNVSPMKFRDGFFPCQGERIKECFEELKQALCPDPDLIFTHCREDRHQDHRAISDLTWNTWRRNLVLEYEIPKYDGDLGHPNLFVPLTKDTCERKIRYILDAFQTESNKAWMSEDTFWAMLRLRGVECAARDRYAEAFHCRKLTLGTGAAAWGGHSLDTGSG